MALIRRHSACATRSVRGVTLIEIMVTIAVMATITAVVLPLARPASGSRLTAATGMLRDDLEQARHRTVTDPGSPVSLALDGDGGGWRLVDANDATIAHSDGRPWRIRFGEGVAAGLEGVTVRRFDEPGVLLLRFDAAGVAIADGTPTFEIEADEDRWTVRLALVTGLVSIEPRAASRLDGGINGVRTP